MEHHTINAADAGEIGAICDAIKAMATRGASGISAAQVKASLTGVQILMSFLSENYPYKDNWDNHEGRSRPVTDLARVIRDEIPGPISERTIERIMSRLQRVQIATIGQLVSRGRWDIEVGSVHLGHFDFRVLEAALALRNLQFHTTAGRG